MIGQVEHVDGSLVFSYGCIVEDAKNFWLIGWTLSGQSGMYVYTGMSASCIAQVVEVFSSTGLVFIEFRASPLSTGSTTCLTAKVVRMNCRNRFCDDETLYLPQTRSAHYWAERCRAADARESYAVSARAPRRWSWRHFPCAL